MPFEPGKWNVICDRCGFQRKNDQVVKTWDNFMVCGPSTGKTCFETRHPQDFVRAKPDNQAVAFVRKAPAETYRTVDTISSTVGVQETTIPTGNFTTNNETLEE